MTHVHPRSATTVRFAPRAYLATLIVILFLAFAVRVWNLGTQSLWHDEAWSVFSGYNPYAPMGIRGADLNAGFAYYSTLALWMRLTGDEVWGMRYWSVLLSLITVAVVALTAQRFLGRRAAILAALLCAFNPMLWVFAQEIRAYVWMPLSAVLLLLLVERLLRAAPSPLRIWLGIAVVEILALYAQNLAVPLVAWLNVTVGIGLLLDRRWRRLRNWALMQIGLLLVYLPWLLTQRPTGSALNTPPALSLDLLWSIWQAHFIGVKALVNADSLISLLLAALGVLAIIALVWLLRQGRSRARWIVLSQVIAIPVFEVAIIRAASIDFHPRYFIVSVPAALIAMAGGVALLTRIDPQAATPWLSRVVRGALQAALVIAAVAVLMRVATVTYSNPIYQHDDFRSIAQHYATLTAQDAIIIPYGWEPTLDYYGRKLGIKAKWVEIPYQSSAQTILAQLPAALQGVQRAELLTWFQLPADVRGAYSCILGAVGQKTEEKTVSGLRTDRYDALYAAIPLTVEASALRFGGLELSADPAPSGLVGTQSVCLISTWRLTTPTDRAWHMVARLYNQLYKQQANQLYYQQAGWMIAQRDALMLNDRQQPTTRWKAGDSVTLFHDLPLPEGAPAARYPITLGVYDPASGTTIPAEQRIGNADFTPAGLTPLWATPLLALVPSAAPALSADVTNSDRLLNDRVAFDSVAGLPTEAMAGDVLRLTLALRTQGLTALVGGGVRLIAAAGETVANTPCLQLPPTAAIPTAAAITRIVWCQLTIPATAQGVMRAEVYLAGGAAVELGTVTIRAPQRITNEPSMVVNLSGTGQLGARGEPPFASLRGGTGPGQIRAGEPLQVTLLWRALATATKPYRVFVHVRAPDGRVIAQSDDEPHDRAASIRRTTSWIAGEVLVDPHTLHWNDVAFRGTAQIVVGMYDPDSFAVNSRLVTSTDQDVIEDVIVVGVVKIE